jgi:hypothetical protein
VIEEVMTVGVSVEHFLIAVSASPGRDLKRGRVDLIASLVPGNLWVISARI